MLYLIGYGSGLSGAASVIASEIYPLSVRATGLSQAVFVNWITNYAVAQSFLSMVEAIGEGGTFAAYAAMSCLGGLLLYRYLPETAGLTLEEIETLFDDPYPHDPEESRRGSAQGLPTTARARAQTEATTPWSSAAFSR